MTSRKRPSLRDNLTDKAEGEMALADRQLAQVAALEELRRGKPADAKLTDGKLAEGKATETVPVTERVTESPVTKVADAPKPAAPVTTVPVTTAPVTTTQVAKTAGAAGTAVPANSAPAKDRSENAVTNRVETGSTPADSEIGPAATPAPVTPPVSPEAQSALADAPVFTRAKVADTASRSTHRTTTAPASPTAAYAGPATPVSATPVSATSVSATSVSAGSTASYNPTRQPVLPAPNSQDSDRRLAFIIGASVASILVLAGFWFAVSISDARSSAASRAEALEARIKALETQLASERSASASRSALLESAVAELRMPLERAAGGASVMGVLTAQQLRQAVHGSGPFMDQLALFRTSNFGNAELAEAIEVIAPRAVEGIASKTELANLFASIVPAVLAAEAETTAHRDIGIGETMWSWMTSLPGTITGSAPSTEITAGVPVDPPYIPDEDRPAALLARAGLMLEAGDLSGAIERLSRLPEPTATVATPWIEEARMRIAADRVSRLLGERIDELLTAVSR